jgi:hypothetical protein
MHVNKEIAQALTGIDAVCQEEIDLQMIKLDGTKNKGVSEAYRCGREDEARCDVSGGCAGVGNRGARQEHDHGERKLAPLRSATRLNISSETSKMHFYQILLF